MYLTFFVIPIENKAEISCSIPVCFAYIIFFDGLKQMLRVFFSYVSHAEVINNKGKADWTPFMRPETGCKFGLAVSCFAKTFLE